MNKSDLKIVFFGTPDFAVESLRAILDNGFNVVGVVTATDKPAGRGHRMLCSAVKEFAVERGLNILQPQKLKDPEFIEQLQALDADLFVVIAFRMMPRVVWSMPRLGTFNLHAALLPKYRGAAPINWAVINGETKTGVTTFFLSDEIDTGDIIDRVEVPILPQENLGDVYDKLMRLGANLTVKTINAIVDGNLVTTPQDTLIENGAETCPAPKIFKDTCHIDWNCPALATHNLVRGLSPYPGAWSTLRSDNTAPTEVKIFRTAPDTAASTGAPGTVTVSNGRMFVDTADNRLEIIDLQIAGKKRMAVADYLRGAHLTNPRFE